MRTKAILGATAAILALSAMALTPFVLLPRFMDLVASSGVKPHPKFTGGPVVRTLDRGAWQVAISAPAGPVGPLERGPRFVQAAWSPVAALPARVEERLDLDGDGRDDVAIAFDVPRDPALPLRGRVEVLDPARVPPLGELGRGGLSALLVRVDARIVARFPLK